VCRYLGKTVYKAVENINTIIGPALKVRGALRRATPNQTHKIITLNLRSLCMCRA
jgi:enolase